MIISLGYLKPAPEYPFGGSANAAFGTPGNGGAFAFADPDTKIGYCYAPNRLGFCMLDNPREIALREALYHDVLGERSQHGAGKPHGHWHNGSRRPRPETWGELCGWYAPDPGPVTNLFLRALIGAGAEVTVRHGHLMLKPLTPTPALRRGMRLYPDDPHDPHVLRAELPDFGTTHRIMFSRRSGSRTAGRLLMDLFSLRQRPEAYNPRRWAGTLAMAGAVALTIRHRQSAPGEHSRHMPPRSLTREAGRFSDRRR